MDVYKAELTRVESEDLNKRFTYHPVKPGQADVYSNLRGEARALAGHICSVSPLSRERSLALTKLEECIMWANAGIARNT